MTESIKQDTNENTLYTKILRKEEANNEVMKEDDQDLKALK
jgi:hypothetical protein